MSITENSGTPVPSDPGPTSLEEVSAAVATAGMDGAEAKARLDEEVLVRKFFKQYDADQSFDKPIRNQIIKDRGYASGETQSNWAVSTNLVGSAIDVMSTTLYARDPDVSAKPAPQVDPPPDPITGLMPPQPTRQRNVELAKSIEIVTSALWKKGKLKKRMHRVTRSTLSVSHGWLKVLPVTARRPDPIATNEFNTQQANLESIQAQITALRAGQTLDGNTASVDDLTAQAAELATSVEGLRAKLEVEYCYGFTFDVVKPENMQVGTDVELLEEYLDSDSITEAMFVPHDSLRAMFPDLRDEDLKTATKYYRKPPVNQNAADGAGNLEGEMANRMYPRQNPSDEVYVTNTNSNDSVPLAKVLEKWNRKDNHIYTAIKGVKVWARQPYTPSFTSSRWYPYFYFSLYEVDGQRCPQSMSSRLSKLNDEYGSVRSNYRLVRQRSIPNTIFDKRAVSDADLDSIKKGLIAEFIGMEPVNPEMKISDVFASKPLPSIDVRLYDPTAIIVDLERTAGLPDPRSGASNEGVSATQSQIQQAGFNSRTESARDLIEEVMSDMAQYTAEIALQTIPEDIAVKIAGPAVLWPKLPLEEIVSMFEVGVKAGTTGKPGASGDKEAWGVILPQLKELAVQIFELQKNPQTIPLATALAEQVVHTMRLFGFEGDLSRFVPSPPLVPPLAPPPLPAPAGEEGAPGSSDTPPGASPDDPAGQVPQPPGSEIQLGLRPQIPEAAQPGFIQ